MACCFSALIYYYSSPSDQGTPSLAPEQKCPYIGSVPSSEGQLFSRYFASPKAYRSIYYKLRMYCDALLCVKVLLNYIDHALLKMISCRN